MTSASQAGTSNINGFDRVEYIRYSGEYVRTGIMNSKLPITKGNILYLQGFADSMMNHRPLFEKIASAGFNIIAFDYVGQGDSTGSMNSMSITKINKLATNVWDYYVDDKAEKKIILGWSTGGLAAYKYGHDFENEVKALILLTPGIIVKPVLSVKLETLTRVNYRMGVHDPHIDPIRPSSPMLVPTFAASLASTAIFKSTRYKLSKKIKGMALFASNDDAYIFSNASYKVLKANNPHFKVHQYKKQGYFLSKGALHELDNEISTIASDVRKRIIAFLNEI